ncbi:MAG: fructose-bisphosphate aldolase [Chloroflexi bacterium]|mgnify:CR=1 FL=1|nr:MAG: fructose-bisphosphate aldolase [Chloroflexota bacterium]
MLFNNKLLNITGRDGKALVIAMDHGRTEGVLQGIERPDKIFDQVLDAGADALMTTFGILKHYAPVLTGRIPTIMRVDGGISLFQHDWLDYSDWRLMYSIEDAQSLGASGVIVMTFIGNEAELETLEITAKVSAAALNTDLVVMSEALPVKSARIPDPLDAFAMASAARLAFEHGADVIKNYYTGSIESYRTVVENNPIPMMIAGGIRSDSVRSVLQSIKDAMAAGASGAVIGRNIWQHPDPPGMTRAISRIIHEDIPVDEALAEVEDATRVR